MAPVSASRADTGLSFTISDLGHRTETSLSRLMDNIELGRIIHVLEGRVSLQTDLGKL